MYGQYVDHVVDLWLGEEYVMDTIIIYWLKHEFKGENALFFQCFLSFSLQNIIFVWFETKTAFDTVQFVYQ